MYAIKLIDLKKTFVTRTVFENVNAGIAYGEKIGVVGANGVGKTTLLRILTGELQPDGGAVQWDKGMSEARIGLLTQQAQWKQGETVRDYVRRAKLKLLVIEHELRLIEQRLGDGAEQSLDHLMERYGQLQEHYEMLGGYTFDQEVARALTEVGLPESTWETAIAQVSGGQKTRAQLARLLLQEPHLLLLDEPTNHLDAETMDWLEDKIREFPGTVLVVSHDRYFLDRVATRILELRPDGMGSYPGNYSAYVQAKELERHTQQASYQKQQAEMRHLQEVIGRFAGWYALAHRHGNPDMATVHARRMKNKERQLERLEANRTERPKDAAAIKVQFDSGDKIGNRLFRTERVAVRYGERVLYEDVNISIERGAKVALVGPNGIGKSTLLKVLTGELAPSHGQVKTSSQVRIGYFGQEVDRLDPEKTILQEVLDVEGMTQTDARTLLACFLFRREDVFKKINTLSQGEKCRVAFVKLYFSGANVLVLDEPTNYLDIPARERIEEALLNFSGTLLLVSHDRYMVQRVANQLLLFEPGRVLHYPDTLDAWNDAQTKRRRSPEEQQREEQRMIWQMELSRLAERLNDPQAKEEDRLQIQAELNRLQQCLRAM